MFLSLNPHCFSSLTLSYETNMTWRDVKTRWNTFICICLWNINTHVQTLFYLLVLELDLSVVLCYNLYSLQFTYEEPFIIILWISNHVDISGLILNPRGRTLIIVDFKPIFHSISEIETETNLTCVRWWLCMFLYQIYIYSVLNLLK